MASARRSSGPKPRTNSSAFVFDEIETGLAEIKAGLDKAARQTKARAAPRKAFAAHLERVEVVIEPEDPPDVRARRRSRSARTSRSGSTLCRRASG